MFDIFVVAVMTSMDWETWLTDKICSQKRQSQPETNQKINIRRTKTALQNSRSMSESETLKQNYCLKFAFELTTLDSIC